eukprot:TRINITY_DN374_c0_g1_i1.p2 TRINITY_DN374_c0_g1~~TRINITY_DN374_c0_g1_i1.p2  ORF type:complete len:133 (-),score=1.77 TRINITY_DN374_c0_g1_i1:35-433(-)
MKIENQVQFANISEIPVKNLHKMMNNFQNLKFVIFPLNNSTKIKGSISFIDDLVFSPVKEIAESMWSTNDHSGHLFAYAFSFLWVKLPIPFHQTGFALTIYEHQGENHFPKFQIKLNLSPASPNFTAFSKQL